MECLGTTKVRGTSQISSTLPTNQSLPTLGTYCTDTYLGRRHTTKSTGKPGDKKSAGLKCQVEANIQQQGCVFAPYRLPTPESIGDIVLVLRLQVPNTALRAPTL